MTNVERMIYNMLHGKEYDSALQSDRKAVADCVQSILDDGRSEGKPDHVIESEIRDAVYERKRRDAGV